MRKFALVAAMVLVSASAQAGQLRSLSIASTDSRPIAAPLPPTSQIAEVPPPAVANPAPAPVTVAPPAPPAPPAPLAAAPQTCAPPVAAPAAPAVAAPVTTETPKYVERPTVAPATTDTRKADGTRPSRRAERERRHRGSYWTANRVIGELHRYGVYW